MRIPIPTIRYVLDEGAKEPTRAHATDSGWDVYVADIGEDARRDLLDSLRKWSQSPMKLTLDTGLHIQPPEGYYFELYPNSRLAKTFFMYSNSVGIIDESYTGAIKVVLDYCRNRYSESDLAFLEGVLKQERPIGQLILRRRLCCVWEKVDSLEETERGAGGFGSSEACELSPQDSPDDSGNLPKGVVLVTHRKTDHDYSYYMVRASKNGTSFCYYVKVQEGMLRVAKELNAHIRGNIKHICKLYGSKTDRSRQELIAYFADLKNELKTIGLVEFCKKLHEEGGENHG